jgi:sec-independent protein translocase protein TatB
MLDIAWPEVIVIGAVALVVIGPKDMPKVMRALGRLAGKARGFVYEIRNSFEQLSAEAELTDDGEKEDGETKPVADKKEEGKPQE